MKRATVIELLGTHPAREPVERIEAMGEACVEIELVEVVAKVLGARWHTWLENPRTLATMENRSTVQSLG